MSAGKAEARREREERGAENDGWRVVVASFLFYPPADGDLLPPGVAVRKEFSWRGKP